MSHSVSKQLLEIFPVTLGELFLQNYAFLTKLLCLAYVCAIGIFVCFQQVSATRKLWLKYLCNVAFLQKYLAIEWDSWHACDSHTEPSRHDMLMCCETCQCFFSDSNTNGVVAFVVRYWWFLYTITGFPLTWKDKESRWFLLAVRQNFMYHPCFSAVDCYIFQSTFGRCLFW